MEAGYWVSAGWWMNADCCWMIAGCWWMIAGCWLIAGCSWDAACGRKSLWMFSGYWWFAAKTILQAKKSLNLFAEVMRKINSMRISCWILDEIKVEKRFASGSRLVDGDKWMIKLRDHGVFIPCYGAIEQLTNRKALRIAMLAKII